MAAACLAVRPHATIEIGSFRGDLGITSEKGKRILVRYCRLFLASGLIVLVAVLSAATRRPCFQPRAGSWHTYKTGHMAASQQGESSATDAASETARDVVATNDNEHSSLHYSDFEESLPAPLPLSAQKHLFRSPPFLQ